MRKTSKKETYIITFFFAVNLIRFASFCTRARQISALPTLRNAKKKERNYAPKARNGPPRREKGGDYGYSGFTHEPDTTLQTLHKTIRPPSRWWHAKLRRAHDGRIGPPARLRPLVLALTAHHASDKFPS